MGQHAAWRHLKVDMPGGIFRGGPPGVPFGYLAGSSVPSPPGRAPDPGRPASLTADRPRAGGAADTGGGPAKPGQCPRIGGHPGHGQRHVGHVLDQLGTASRTESVARARVLSLIPGRGPSQPRPVTAFLRGPGTNAGPGYTLVPGTPRKIPPGMSPFGGRLARPIFLACGERNAHRKEDAQWPPSSPARPTAAPRSPAPPRPPPADPPLYPGGLRLRYSVLLSTGS